MWSVKEYAIGKDVVVLDKYAHEDVLAYFKGTAPPMVLSYPTFTRGLAELEKAQIIAKTVRAGHYFINPNCMFNGDRVAFSTIIEREPEEQGELPV
jgi:hypothetical protein